MLLQNVKYHYLFPRSWQLLWQEFIRWDGITGGVPAPSSVKVGVGWGSPLGLGLWAGEASGGAGRGGLSRACLPPTQAAVWKPLPLWGPSVLTGQPPCPIIYPAITHISVWGRRLIRLILQVRNLRLIHRWQAGETDEMIWDLEESTAVWDLTPSPGKCEFGGCLQTMVLQTRPSVPSFPAQATASSRLPQGKFGEPKGDEKCFEKVWNQAQPSHYCCYAVNYCKVISGWQPGLF